MFGLLGPMQLGVAERSVDPGPPRQRCVLAALLVDAGRLVTWETLIDRVWGDAPPARARHSLYSHVARIRRVLAHTALPEARLVRQSGGYRLEADPDLVDVHRFQDLVSRAHHLDDADHAKAALLSEALGLWRGEPLAGLGGPWVAQTRAAWRQQQLDATLAWARAELGIGHPDPVIGSLTELVREHPLVEPAAALLMRALSVSGRDPEALDRYAQTRQQLVEELGTEPGAELRGMHQAILRGELNRSVPALPAAGTPRQLPLPARGFVGRVKELARLDTVLAGMDAQPTAATIVTLSGMAGVGKTTLAVHWAQRITDRFPDGQLFVNLRGFDSGSPMAPADVVRGFLDAFGLPPQRIPARSDAQLALYRSLSTGRRVLVLLDNARDVDQVRPLLPDSPECLVVVTSRERMSGLTVSNGAHPVMLTPLSVTEARQLLTHRLGDRAAAEPDAVDEIVSRCGRLPVALAVVAARAAHTGFPLTTIAEELRGTGAILDVLGSGDPATDVRAVFSWSYQTLRDPAARLFRLLALNPSPQIGTPAAASLAGSSIAQVRPLLAELARTHLLGEHLPGRFTFHDLLRAFATELAHGFDTEADRRAATRRMLDHYLLTAHTADTLVEPHRDPITPATPTAAVTPEDITTVTQALDWFAREHTALLPVLDLAVAAGMDAHAWQLAWSLGTFHVYRGHWHDQIATQRIALAAAQRLDHPLWQAHAHHDLGRAYTRLRHYGEADAHLCRALDLYTEVDDLKGQASAHYFLGSLADRRGDGHDAMHRARRCRDLYQAVGDPAGQARALTALCLAHNMNGHHRQALAYGHQAVALSRDLGDHRQEATALEGLGLVHRRLGSHHRSITWYGQALTRLRDIGDRYSEANILAHLGDAHHGHGDVAAATEAWTQALAILDELDLPEAQQVRDKLRDTVRIATN